MQVSRGLAVLAALSGAAAVALAAAGAHIDADPRLATGAQILLPHAVAALAFLALERADRRPNRGLIAAAALVLLGASLFAADMAARVFWGHGVFPGAAPAGGMTTVVGWLVGVVASARMTATRPGDRATGANAAKSP